MHITYRKEKIGKYYFPYRMVEDGDKTTYEAYHWGLKKWVKDEDAFNEFTCRTFDSWPATEEEVNEIIKNHK
jgi:hypothetical protein